MALANPTCARVSNMSLDIQKGCTTSHVLYCAGIQSHAPYSPEFMLLLLVLQ